MASGAVISANGTDGAGGDIVLWSQKQTRFKGVLSAQGSHGAAGGNAEVSSHEILDFKGQVNLLSPGGATGNLLLDPSNVTITDSGDMGENLLCTIGACTFHPTAYDSNIDVATLESALSDANVTVSTQSSKDNTGDISVMDPVAWSANTLTLDAYHSIYLASTLSATGSAGLALKTNDGGSDGDYYFDGGNITFANLSESLTINGGTYTLVDTVSGLASAIASNPSGFFALANSYNARTDGTYGTVPVPTAFSGVFEGLGNWISNLTIDDSGDTSVGLFATTQAAVIRDITLASPSITAGGGVEYVGTLVGDSTAGDPLNDTITGASVYYSSELVAQYVGGLAGAVSGGTINNSTVDNNSQMITNPSGDSVLYVEGLVGNASLATIEYSSSGAFINAQSPHNAEVGGLVGYSSSTIEDSFESGVVRSTIANVCAPPPCTNHSNVGGLVGHQFGSSVESSYASGPVVSNGSSSTYSTTTGELIGYLTTDGSGDGGTVTGSYATGAVSVNPNASTLGAYEGGLVGWADTNTSIGTSYAAGSVTGNAAVAGGLVGLNDGAISGSSAVQSGSGPDGDYPSGGPLVASSASGANVGGLVGANESDGSIIQSFAAQQMSVNNYAILGGSNSKVGGLAGYNDGQIENSYSYPTYSSSCNNCTLPLIYGGTATDSGPSYVGGLVGEDDTSAQIISSYSTGSVGSGYSGSNLGGSIGYDNGLNNGSKQYVYWDTDTSGTDCATGNSGCSADSGVTGKTTHQLTSGLPNGLRSPTWYEISGVNNGLPCLSNVTGGCGG
ncbi:MAG TPA: GLUG motif-containing protein [Rhizomicrobium sp.]|jgi:hypothetical protein|nr:GLUG motif-containing protein [Rhizomicrobium sp.]